MTLGKIVEISTTIRDQLIEYYRNENIDKQKLLQVAVTAMEYIDNYKELRGDEKKQILNMALENFIDTMVSDEGQKSSLLDLQHEILPLFIDLVVSATKGNFDINKARKCATSCFAWCSKL